MDAVTHCIEAVLSPRENPPCEAIGYDGVHRAVGDGWLKRAVADGSDDEARYHMMMASYEGALAFMKGLGGVHALSHAAGRLHEKRLHHGTLNAIFLPHLLRANEGAAEKKYARLRFAMGLPEDGNLAEAIDRLNADIGIPAKLSDIGVEASDGPGIGEPPVEKDPLRASADALLAGGAGGGNGHGTLAKQGPGAGRPAPPLTDAAACIDFAHEAAIRAMEARVHAVGDAQLTALWHGLKSVAYAAKLAIREE
jgi:hypothetical protein